MEEQTLSRREREKLRQRGEIMAAALALFSEKGYHNVSMQEIAERSEFAIGTLYKFFKNKENLYETIILESSLKFNQALMDALAEGPDEVELLKNYVQTVFALFQDNAATIRLYFAVTRGVNFPSRSSFDITIRERHTQVLGRLATIIEKGVRKKRFNRIAAPHHVAVAVHGVTASFLFHWLEDPDNHPYPEDPNVILNIFFQSMLTD